MKPMLGVFASSWAQRQFGADANASVWLDSALRHYGCCLESNSDLVGLPRGLDLHLDAPAIEIEAELSASSIALLERESQRLGVDRQFLLNHAVIVYIAYLDRRPPRQCGGRKRGRPALRR